MNYKAPQNGDTCQSLHPQDLRWWQYVMPILNGTKSVYMDVFFEPGTLIDTDATLVGAGGVCKGHYFDTQFPQFIIQQAHIIAHLKLLAFIVALKTWPHFICNTKFVVRLDNMVAILANNTGHSKDPFINAGLWEIAFLSALHNFEVRAHHILGVNNTIPDLLSHWHLGDAACQQFNMLNQDNHLTRNAIDAQWFQFIHECNSFHSAHAPSLLFTFLLNFLLIFVFSVCEWVRLNKEGLTFLHSGRNPGTWKNFGCHIKTYWSFANHFQFSLLPLQITYICLFAAHIAVQGKSHATIRNYLNSLSTYGQLLGYPPLNLQNVFIHLTLTGILQMVKLKLSIAQPLSLTMLNKMVNHTDFDHTIQVATWAAIVLGFHLLLCKSNLVPNSVAEFKTATKL